MSAVTSPSRIVIPAPQPEGKMLAGVAAGLGEWLAVDPLVIRLAFVALTAAGGVGVLLYLACWGVMATAGSVGARPVELGGHLDRVVGIGLVTVGVALLVEAVGLGFGSRVGPPVGLVALGLLVAWHRGRLGALVEGDRTRLVRIGAGVALAVAGLIGLFALNLDFADARDTIVLTAVVAVGLSLVAGPAVSGLVRDLGEERRQRVRSEERARMAAHLHDSVLQTLALIQRSADDPTRMRSLARRQERELRAWLFGEGETGAGTLRSDLERVCAEAEELHGVPVELVVVGDVPADGRVREALAAAREAVVNAARHAGAPRVDVFAEVAPGTLEIFVRDVGAGFEPDAAPPDRRGVRDSIVARMQRVGGQATITSAPGAGTEVEIVLPLEAS